MQTPVSFVTFKVTCRVAKGNFLQICLYLYGMKAKSRCAIALKATQLAHCNVGR